MRASSIQDPFLKKALELAVDNGVEPARIRDIMELEISLFEQNADAESKVFEAAGGYAPTIGIIDERCWAPHPGNEEPRQCR